ncbi:MAG: hypothetical protein LBO74_08290, partial [Candidatus Symbiothrix sp.]|jgi:hypothetical protein|nr:hypothetical protein [Candidatus Symbiothrix sp.]
MYFMLSLLLVMTTGLKAQVVIGTNAAEPVASAVLDLNSGIDGNLGLLLPRVALTGDKDVTTIPSPATGLMVYATGTDGLAAGVYVWDGTKWETEGSPISHPEDYPAILPAGITVSLSGTSCFDVRAALVEDSEYTLTVTGAQRVDKVTWVITETKPVQSSTATTTDNHATLHFKGFAEVSAVAPATITITAYADITKLDDTNAKLSTSKTITFMNNTCCAGLLVPRGKWVGPDEVPATAQFESKKADAILALYTRTDTDLCWSAPAGLHTGQAYEYIAVIKLCEEVGKITPGWRTPNVAEAAQRLWDFPATPQNNNDVTSNTVSWPAVRGTYWTVFLEANQLWVKSAAAGQYAPKTCVRDM